MSRIQQQAAQLAAETANLAADIRTRDETANTRQKAIWSRNADRPEREKKSRTARGVDALLRACKFTPADIAALWPVLWAILKVADGADLEEYFSLPDAVGGALLESWPAAELEALRRRGKEHPDADRLAKAWTRALERCDLIFERVGLKLFDRKHGYKNATGNVASKVCAPFVQWLVDVDKAAASLRVRAFDLRYQRAAELVVKDLPRHKPVVESQCPACQSDNCPHTRAPGRRPPKEKSAADRCVKFLTKLPELVDRMLADVPPELRADLYEPARKLLQARLTGEVEEEDQGDAELSTIDQEKNSGHESVTQEMAAEGAQNTQPEHTEAAKHAGAEQIRVDRFVTQKHTLTSAEFALYARAVKERAAALEQEHRLTAQAAESAALAEFGSAEAWAKCHLKRSSTG